MGGGSQRGPWRRGISRSVLAHVQVQLGETVFFYLVQLLDIQDHLSLVITTQLEPLEQMDCRCDTRDAR
eukprot:scaffold67044_cov38-Attheya_sp.AAC.1